MLLDKLLTLLSELFVGVRDLFILVCACLDFPTIQALYNLVEFLEELSRFDSGI